MWHFSTTEALQSQNVAAKVMYMNRNYVLDAMGKVDYKGSFETETHLARFLDHRQFLKLYVGSDIRRSHESLDGSHSGNILLENRTFATLGIQYLLPMFINADLRISHTGKPRLQLSKTDWAFTSRLRFDALWNTDKEYELGLRYILTKRWSLSATYDSHFGLGAGLTFTH